MAKRITKPKERAVEPAWYTVGWSYAEKQRGGAVGGSLEVRTRSKAEAQAIVEGKLRAKGITWKDITIVKGRNPGLTRTGGVDRYAAELQSMVGRLHLNAAGPNTPSPIWVHGDPTHDPDATARTMWAKFMDESSHGLSVSDFPRFVICDVNGYPTLPLPSEAVKDETRWDGITAVVREQLDYWKATLQERIERLGKIKRRSAEDTDQLKRDKATLKELEAFDGWKYQRYVEQLLPGRKPHALDLDNRRLYRLSNGQLIPVSDLGTYVLRVDFWRRLLVLWDGPMDKRADNVRAFLDHHHRNGGKPEQFRDLVKDTLPRLRKLTGRELLVEKVEGWLQVAVQYPAEQMPTEAELSQLDGMRWVLVKCVRKPTAPWWNNHHTVRPGEIGMEEVKAVIASPECYQFVPATSEEARGKVERMVNKNPGLRLTPIDGTIPHGMDTRNPYRTFNDGRLFAEVNGSSGVWNFLNRLRHEAAQLATRATNVDALLDHHLGGSNPDAFVEFIRGEVLTWKSGRGPHPNSLKGWLAANGMLSDNAVTEDPWLVDRCERWLERVGKAGQKANATPTPQPVLTVPVLARLCWCMERAGHSDHGIVNATAASRLAKHYGQLHDRAGEKLKQERDRFDGADGKPYLKGGPRSRETYGRRTWAAVKAELDRLGQVDAAAHAEAILSDL